MKKIIIVAPHFPPSNLAGVHRSRLFAKHLDKFGYQPIIVTVDEKYYEEKLDPKLLELISPNLRIEKVKAISTKPVKIIGDIGIRGFYFLYKKIIDIIKHEEIAFLYIPIPSHFASLLGRLIFERTGVKYGIDYIDPWVHYWPGSEKTFTKAWFSRKLSEYLEPIAVKKASLISGVADGYYADVLKRNPHLKTSSQQIAMPYGGETEDHRIIDQSDYEPYIFQKVEGKVDLVYAGAMLPKAFAPLEAIMQIIKKHKAEFAAYRFHFIGSGKSPNDPHGYNIKDLAVKYDLWESVFYEHPQRIPYLDVLGHLSVADGSFILGSTEPHYTPSKVYQSVLSKLPIFAILHEKSTACDVIIRSKAGIVLSFNGANDLEKILENFMIEWQKFKIFLSEFDSGKVDLTEFDKFSAYNTTKILAGSLDMIL